MTGEGSDPRRPTCPDSGACHHECADGPCFRVGAGEPLSGVYPGDQWPSDVHAAHGVDLSPGRVAGLGFTWDEIDGAVRIIDNNGGIHMAGHWETALIRHIEGTVPGPADQDSRALLVELLGVIDGAVAEAIKEQGQEVVVDRRSEREDAQDVTVFTVDPDEIGGHVRARVARDLRTTLLRLAGQRPGGRGGAEPL